MNIATDCGICFEPFESTQTEDNEGKPQDKRPVLSQKCNMLCIAWIAFKQCWRLIAWPGSGIHVSCVRRRKCFHRQNYVVNHALCVLIATGWDGTVPAAMAHQPATVVTHGRRIQTTPPRDVATGIMPGFEDCLTYIAQVKAEVDSRLYNEFLSILIEHNKNRIGLPGALARVSNLFGGQHNNLILGFNVFMLEACKISLADLEASK